MQMSKLEQAVDLYTTFNNLLKGYKRQKNATEQTDIEIVVYDDFNTTISIGADMALQLLWNSLELYYTKLEDIGILHEKKLEQYINED